MRFGIIVAFFFAKINSNLRNFVAIVTFIRERKKSEVFWYVGEQFQRTNGGSRGKRER